MCGIMAVLGGSLPTDEAKAGQALDLLRHRGPDDRGTWSSRDAWLGSRRLAVLDTSERGHQPMVDPETGIVVVLNGEIYNYVELRQELSAEGVGFSSGSDTEVLLQAYVRWGTRCVERFNGMWAFVLFDPRTRSAFFSRDRFGAKPLWATYARERLSLASEPKALLALYPELRKADERTLFEFLALGRLYDGTRSFLEGIVAIPPGSAGTLALGQRRPEVRQFWSYPTPGSAGDASDDEVLGEFARLLEDAVRIRMRSDVPVGISLSGGLDSTAVVHGAAVTLARGQVLTAFTSVFEEAPGLVARDERAWARRASDRYPSIELEQVPTDASGWRETFRRALWHLDGPNYSPAVVPLWAIMERAHERGVKVMLEGQGGDELLGGYVHHAALAALSRLRGEGSGRVRIVGDVREYARTFGLLTFLLWMLRELAPVTRHAYRDRYGTASVLSASFRARFADVSAPRPANRLGPRLVEDYSASILPALLHYGDAISSAHSVESRQPFLDFRLVDYCVRLGDRWKTWGGETKRIERQYLEAIGQAEIARRVDKRGFPTPIWHWLVADDAAEPRELLLGPDGQLVARCDRKALIGLIERTARKPETGAAHLYRLVATELWLRTVQGG